MIDYALSVRLLLDSLTQGHLMRNVMGRFVQLLAVVVGFGLLLSWIGLWTLMGAFGPWAALALTVTQIVLLGAFAKIVQVIYVRGEDIRNLPESEFAMMSIFATLVRLPGEIALVFFALFSVPAMFLTWAGAGQIVSMFGVPVLAGHALIAGVVSFISCWIAGFVGLVACSLLAEVISALYSIAHDLRSARRTLESSAQANTAAPHARAA